MTSASKLLVFWFVYYFLSFLSSIHAKCLSDQRSYLLPFGNASQPVLKWNESMDCCEWEGVVCDGVGHVISLFLENKVIDTGSNADWKSVFNLQYLEVLDLYGSSFGGIAIPVELYNLTRLKYLDLSFSDFSGQIPIGLSKLTSLVTLNLYNVSGLEVKNPGGLEILFQNLTQLEQLHLEDILAPKNAWCNVLSSLSKLQALSLKDCELSGSCSSPTLGEYGLDQFQQLWRIKADLEREVPLLEVGAINVEREFQRLYSFLFDVKWKTKCDRDVVLNFHKFRGNKELQKLGHAVELDFYFLTYWFVIILLLNSFGKI